MDHCRGNKAYYYNFTIRIFICDSIALHDCNFTKDLFGTMYFSVCNIFFQQSTIFKNIMKTIKIFCFDFTTIATTCAKSDNENTSKKSSYIFNILKYRSV